MRKIGVVLGMLLALSLGISTVGCAREIASTPTLTPTPTPAVTPTPTLAPTSAPTPSPTPTPSPVPKELERGYSYLEDNLNSSLNLIRESPDTGTPQDRTYYLVTDNFLASYALKAYNPGLSKTLMSAIEEYGYKHDHYIEVLFGNCIIEPIYAVPVPPENVEENDDVYYIKTEKVTDIVMEDYHQYLDRLCYEVLWKAYGGEPFGGQHSFQSSPKHVG